jgi:hypothetical protein
MLMGKFEKSLPGRGEGHVSGRYSRVINIGAHAVIYVAREVKALGLFYGRFPWR